MENHVISYATSYTTKMKEGPKYTDYYLSFPIDVNNTSWWQKLNSLQVTKIVII